MRGLGTAGRWFGRERYCCLQSSITCRDRVSHVAAHRFSAGWFTHRANDDQSGQSSIWVALVHGRQRPAPAGQFTGDRDIGHERILAPLVKRLPPLVEAAVAGMPAGL